METSPAQQIKVDTFNDVYSESSLFKVAAINEGKCSFASYNRRDFFKISLVLNGCSHLHYANRSIEINQPALVFTNPLVPYSWEGSEITDLNNLGYFCVFTDSFLRAGAKMESLSEFTLFKPGGNPVYLLNPDQVAYLTSMFIRMREEVDNEYFYKYEIIRSQLNIIIHEAIKMQPATAVVTPQNAASRIAKLFLGLLEKQFPVDSPRYALKLRKASDYAGQLAVHVNHLNAAVHHTTGKTTTAHINERILSEAKSMLKHTDWSIAQIADCLGFDYASYFNNFFKKHTGYTPLSLRKSV